MSLLDLALDVLLITYFLFTSVFIILNLQLFQMFKKYNFIS